MQPSSPTPEQPYDFIFKEAAKPQKKLLPNMSGPVLILAVAVGLTILLLLFSVLFLGKGKTSNPDLVDVLGQAQEISRVNTLQEPLLKEPANLDLLATTQIVLASEQSQLNAYAKTHKLKINPTDLLGYKDPKTDSQLQNSAQNNSLDTDYELYLRKALASYSDSIAKAYKNTKDTQLKTILKAAYDSTQTLLGNPPKAT